MQNGHLVTHSMSILRIPARLLYTKSRSLLEFWTPANREPIGRNPEYQAPSLFTTPYPGRAAPILSAAEQQESAPIHPRSRRFQGVHL